MTVTLHIPVEVGKVLLAWAFCEIISFRMAWLSMDPLCFQKIHQLQAFFPLSFSTTPCMVQKPGSIFIGPHLHHFCLNWSMTLFSGAVSHALLIYYSL